MHSIVFSVSLSTVFVSLSPFLIFLTLIPPCHAHTNTYKIWTRTQAHTRVDEHESGCVPRSPGVCQENHICNSAALCFILFAELSVSPPTSLSFSYTMCTSIHIHIRARALPLSLCLNLSLSHTHLQEHHICSSGHRIVPAIPPFCIHCIVTYLHVFLHCKHFLSYCLPLVLPNNLPRARHPTKPTPPYPSTQRCAQSRAKNYGNAI